GHGGAPSEVLVGAGLGIVRGRLAQAHWRLRGHARLGARAQDRGDRRVPRLRVLLAVTVPVRRTRLLPDRRRGTAAAPREGAGGETDRRDRKVLPARRGLYPPRHPRQVDGPN